MNYSTNAQIQPASDPKPLGKVFTKASELAESVNYMHKIFSDLEERLGSVLRPPAPEKAGNLASVDEYMCGVAEQFHLQQKSVIGMIDRIKSVLDRLEI